MKETNGRSELGATIESLSGSLIEFNGILFHEREPISLIEYGASVH